MSELEFDVPPPESTAKPPAALSRSESEAYRAFVEQTWTEAWRVAWWITWGDEENAREIRAEAYAVLARRWREEVSGRDHDGRKLWVFKAMRNCELARHRREVSQITKALKDTPLSRKESRSPEEAVLGQMMVDEFFKLAAEIVTAQQLYILVLRIQAGWDYAAIAAYLGITEVAVRSQVSKAKGLLAEHPEIRAITGYGEKEGDR